MSGAPGRSQPAVPTWDGERSERPGRFTTLGIGAQRASAALALLSF
jgi:hypothetical protein